MKSIKILSLFSLALCVTFVEGRRSITKGSDASAIDFPFMVLISQDFEDYKKTATYFCSGALIDFDTVVTSTHCLREINEGLESEASTNLTIYAGNSRLSQEKDPDEQESISEKIYYAENDGIQVDLAVIKLSRPFAWTLTVDKVDLLDLDLNSSHVGIALGWKAKTTGNLQNVSWNLQRVDLPIRDKIACDAEFRVSKLKGITDDYFCAGGIEEGKTTCLGDQGGPFIYRSPDGITSLHGIAADSKECSGKPGVFILVPKYLKWIEEKRATEISEAEEDPSSNVITSKPDPSTDSYSSTPDPPSTSFATEPPSDSSTSVDPITESSTSVEPPSDSTLVDPPPDSSTSVNPPPNSSSSVDPPSDSSTSVSPPPDSSPSVDPPPDSSPSADSSAHSSTSVNPSSDSTTTVLPDHSSTSDSTTNLSDSTTIPDTPDSSDHCHCKNGAKTPSLQPFLLIFLGVLCLR